MAEQTALTVPQSSQLQYIGSLRSTTNLWENPQKPQGFVWAGTLQPIPNPCIPIPMICMGYPYPYYTLLLLDSGGRHSIPKVAALVPVDP